MILRKLNFNELDQKTLMNLLKEISKEAKQTISLSALLKHWIVFVYKVARGYQDSIYEYTNDLSTRDTLQSILQHLTREGRKELLLVLNPLDNQLMANTKVLSRPINLYDESNNYWWWHRIPKVTMGEFEEDLITEGFLKEKMMLGEYVFPQLLPHLRILCTPKEYLRFFETPEDYLQKYGEHFSKSPGYIPYKNPNSWRVIPTYKYAECPICYTPIYDPGDNYTIRVGGMSRVV